jgi:hypothetical protein
VKKTSGVSESEGVELFVSWEQQSVVRECEARKVERRRRRRGGEGLDERVVECGVGVV